MINSIFLFGGKCFLEIVVNKCSPILIKFEKKKWGSDDFILGGWGMWDIFDFFKSWFSTHAIEKSCINLRRNVFWKNVVLIFFPFE